MPTHLKRICLVIDKLPSDLNFDVSLQSELGESRLSQVLESHHLSDQSSHDAASLLEEADSQSSYVGDVTPHTSMSQRIEGEHLKSRGKGVVNSVPGHKSIFEAYRLLQRVLGKL